jgi:hypothetical protein
MAGKHMPCRVIDGCVFDTVLEGLVQTRVLTSRSVIVSFGGTAAQLLRCPSWKCALLPIPWHMHTTNLGSQHKSCSL